MKKFFAEFKKFITRGNVVDMAVGVIIGGAFTAIVTALTNQILMPVVNYVLALITGGKGMEGAITILGEAVYTEEGVLDLANTIYIDWGAFITAILNFIIIALVLFVIVKTINKVKEAGAANYHGYTKEEYRALRKSGKTNSEIEAMAAERDRAAAEAAAKAAEPTAEQKLLAEILETLKNK